MCANSYNYLDWLIVIHQIEMLLWHPVYLNLSVLPYILFLLHSVFDILSWCSCVLTMTLQCLTSSCYSLLTMTLQCDHCTMFFCSVGQCRDEREVIQTHFTIIAFGMPL